MFDDYIKESETIHIQPINWKPFDPRVVADTFMEDDHILCQGKWKNSFSK